MTDKKMDCGVVYIVTGKKYIRAAIRSARSVRSCSPELGIHLFADWKSSGFNFMSSIEPFTSIEDIPNPHYRSKVDYIIQTPFKRTLYLDGDTKVVSDIEPIFALLDQFDVALAHAPNRVTRLRSWRISIPDAFPQFNAGVFLYRKNDKVFKLLRKWISSFHEAGFFSDQITLRELLWLSDLRIATLPPEYNLRRIKYLLFWGRREARPRILHLSYFVNGPFWFLIPWVRQIRIKLGYPDPKRDRSYL